jgi:very-short-patch-repair endonuclease
MTSPEILLWDRIRGSTSDCPKFRRQHPFGSIILDFYCPAARLAVQVDGATHWDCQERDEARDRWLERQGVTVVRIPASTIYRDAGAVADGLLLKAEALLANG